MTPIAGMKNVAGTWCRSRRSRILGTDVVAPYSPNRQGHGQRIRSCNQLIVDIEGEADGDPRAVGPGLGRELSADPRRPDRLPNLLLCGIDRDRIHGARRLLV